MEPLGSTDVQTGREVDGFTLGERLHGGAMSRVFRVTKPGLERALVMKLPQLGPSQNESVIAFETEVSILPALSGQVRSPSTWTD